MNNNSLLEVCKEAKTLYELTELEILALDIFVNLNPAMLALLGPDPGRLLRALAHILDVKMELEKKR